MTNRNVRRPSLEIRVLQERCIGAGNCADVAPSHFAQDSADGSVVLKQTGVNAQFERLVQTAAELCPVQAILLGSRD